MPTFDPRRAELIGFLQASTWLPAMYKAGAIFAVSNPKLLTPDKLDFVCNLLAEVKPKLEAGDFDAAMDVLRAAGIPEEAIAQGRKMLDGADTNRREVNGSSPAVRANGIG